MFAKRLFVVIALLMVTYSTLGATTVHAQPPAQRGCPGDRPCITSDYFPGTSFRIGWTSPQSYDFYQVRWSRPGRGETQVTINSGGSSGYFLLRNAWHNTTYTFKVQGCDSSFWSGSDCSAWYELRVRT